MTCSNLRMDNQRYLFRRTQTRLHISKYILAHCVCLAQFITCSTTDKNLSTKLILSFSHAKSNKTYQRRTFSTVFLSYKKLKFSTFQDYFKNNPKAKIVKRVLFYALKICKSNTVNDKFLTEAHKILSFSKRQTKSIKTALVCITFL